MSSYAISRNNCSCDHALFGRFFAEEYCGFKGLQNLTQARIEAERPTSASHVQSMGQNEMVTDSDFHKKFLFSDEAQFLLNACVSKQN